MVFNTSANLSESGDFFVASGSKTSQGSLKTTGSSWLFASRKEESSEEMKQKFSSRLGRFIVFNPNWGQREGDEHEKIIYYYVPGTANSSRDSPSLWEEAYDLNNAEFQSVIKDVGFCEAIIRFVKNFGEQEEISAAHGSKVRLVLEEVEPNYWIAAQLFVPKTVSKCNTKEGDEQLIEYHGDELNDHYVRLIIRQIYETFSLFHRSFAHTYEHCGQDLIRMRDHCGTFLCWFLSTIKVSAVNLLEILGAIAYLPLDSLTFLQAQSFLAHVTHVHECFGILLLYNDQLVFSDLQLQDTKHIYRYLVSIMLAEASSQELSESFKSKASSRTRWIMRDTLVHVHVNKIKQICSLNVYRSNNGGTVALILRHTQDTPKNEKTEEDVSSTMEETLHKFHAYMAPRLLDITTRLANQSIRLAESTGSNTNTNNTGISANNMIEQEQFKYAIYNANNGAYKSNGTLAGMFDQRKLLDAEFIKLLLDVESDLRGVLGVDEKDQPLGDNIVELVAKSTNDNWLVVHELDQRKLFSLLSHKNANLIEAFETSQQFMQKHLRNILFVD